jgi:hypothetical protein
MHPDVRRDLPLLRQLNHVHRRGIAALLARPVFQRRLKFPDRRVARTPDRIERDAGTRLAKGCTRNSSATIRKIAAKR